MIILNFVKLGSHWLGLQNKLQSKMGSLAHIYFHIKRSFLHAIYVSTYDSLADTSLSDTLKTWLMYPRATSSLSSSTIGVKPIIQ